MSKRRPSGDGMVRKREDGRWEGRIVVGHKENGEPIFRYVLAKTQKELLAKLHRDMEIYQDAQLTEDSRMTLGEYLDRWMEGVRRRHPATQHPAQLRAVHPVLCKALPGRQDRLPHHAVGHPKAVPETEKRAGFTTTRSMAMNCQTPWCSHPRHAPPLSLRTRRDHIIPYNPTDGVKLPKSNYKPKQILDREQMDAFLAAVDRNEIWRDFFYTELTTGLRRARSAALCGRTSTSTPGR